MSKVVLRNSLALVLFIAPATAAAQPEPPPEAPAEGDATEQKEREAPAPEPPSVPEPPPPAAAEAGEAVEAGSEDDEIDALDALDAAGDRPPPPFVIPDFSRQPLSPDEAGAGRPRHRWIWTNLFIGRVNPLGLANRFDTGWRVQMLDKPGPLYDQSQASLLFHTTFSPAFSQVGARMEFQPLSVIRFGVTYAFVGAHGAFDFLQPFDSPDEEFDDQTIDDRADLNQTATGHYLEPGVLVQAKVGPIAVRNEVKGTYRSMGRIGRDQYFWDPVLDVMFPNNGWALSNDMDLLYLFDFGLTVGARWTYTNVFYDDDVDLSGPAGDNVPTHRVGPAVLYKFFEDPAPTRWNAPTIGVLTQWWLRHRYRTGHAPQNTALEDRSITQALPYILLLFIQKGDFFPAPAPAE